MLKIESSSNAVIKNTKKLLTRSGRKKTDTFIIEGERIVKDAVRNGADIKYIIVSESYHGDTDFGEVRTYCVTDKLFEEFKSTVNSQGIIAVAGYINKNLSELNFSGGVYLYLDSVQDPGNMGTIIRSADAFGVKGVVLSAGCVDVFNPKVLRSTMSGIFSVDIFFDDGSAIKKFADNGYDVVGTFPVGSTNSCQYEYLPKTLVVMGNEANGICPEIEKMCTGRVSIPMSGNAESLNVSVACGIMLYEVFTKTNWA